MASWITDTDDLGVLDDSVDAGSSRGVAAVGVYDDDELGILDDDDDLAAAERR